MLSLTSKIRDSCNACATSKIKCPKEKPSCSRCESRSVACHYSFTKRPGRKSENGSSRPSIDTITVGGTPGNHDGNADNDHDGNDHDGNHPGNGEQLAYQTSRPSLDALFWPESPTPASMTPSKTPVINTNANTNGYSGITHPPRPSVVSSPGLEDAHAQAASSDVMSMLGDTHNIYDTYDIHTFPEFDGFGYKMDEFLESAIESHFALPKPDNSDNTTITPTQNDIASLLIPAVSTSANIGASEAPSATDSGSTSSSSIFSWPAPTYSTSSTLSLLLMSSSPSKLLQLPGVADSSSSCHLAQTLDILKTLSSAQSSRLTTFAGPDTSSDADAFTKAVLGENQQSIDAVGAILSSSSCGNDSFLLAILSMTVLKILERYDAAAKAQPIEPESDWEPSFSNSLISHSTGQDHRRTLSTSALRHDDSGRETVAARLVLGELYRVQRLVNELSRESEKHREGGGDLAMRDGRKPTRPLVTTSTLAQLEIDMRNSLNALSTGIIDRLRQR